MARGLLKKKTAKKEPAKKQQGGEFELMPQYTKTGSNILRTGAPHRPSTLDIQKTVNPKSTDPWKTRKMKGVKPLPPRRNDGMTAR